MARRFSLIAAGLWMAACGIASCSDGERSTSVPLDQQREPANSATVVATTQAPVEVLAYAPRLSITCPVVASLDGESVLVEFGWEATIADEELVSATIDYGDGTTYQSTTMADVERNMFWHRYRDEGSYSVIVTFEHLDGATTADCSFGIEADTRVTTSRTSISSSVPVPDATACDSNYEGACVPVASDVDCAGGSGNGPAYVRGPVWVVGTDLYGLDRDGDGVGCE